MGFEVLTAKKGIFVDGHELPDVVESQTKLLRKMVKLGFLHFTNAPTQQAGQAIPEDVYPPILEKREKTVVFSTTKRPFSPIRTRVCSGGGGGGGKETIIMKPKYRGAGIIILMSTLAFSVSQIRSMKE